MKYVCFLLLALAAGAHAHGFEERYDLPVPLAYVVAGACATVLLTFVVAIFFARQPAPRPTPAENETPGTLPRSALIWLLRGFAWLLFVLTLVAALWGSADPLMNLAPTLVWIVWWVGLSFAVTLAGNFWPLLDPWRTSHDMLAACFEKFGLAKNWRPARPWPGWLGVWPAVALLLLWCGLEVIYPIAATPFKLGCFALGWTALNLAGMACFGRATWQAHVDVFALYFATLGQTARIRRSSATAPAAGKVGFVMAMLASVLFDGLHGSAAWLGFENTLGRLAPQWLDVNGYVAGSVGLVTVWLVFLLAYLFTCQISTSIVQQPGSAKPSPALAVRFVPALIPIAAAYNIAHNFSNLLIQGQSIFQLMSDPLGRQWDLFGTAKFYPDIGMVDARLTWYVAVTAIVLGHWVSIWLSHRIALTLGLTPKQTALAALPLTLLMVAYTAISLIVIAEPMVT